MKGMAPFHLLFPEIAKKEIRTATVMRGDSRLPADEYGFLELYCVDPECDCRRVLINVMARSSGEHVATLSHSYKPPHPDDDMGQTFLDPLNKQSTHSEGLLGLFKEMLLDLEYHKRLERHYRMVKAAIADHSSPVHEVLASVEPAELPRVEELYDLDPYLPCPCGSGKKYKWCCRNRDKKRGKPSEDFERLQEIIDKKKI